MRATPNRKFQAVIAPAVLLCLSVGAAGIEAYDTRLERLLESGPDRVVVHWRHFRNVATVATANAELDPLNPHGITGVVHEVFTIHPDGTVEREVRDAANTRYEDWIDPRLATRQSLKLTGRGIEHGFLQEWTTSTEPNLLQTSCA